MDRKGADTNIFAPQQAMNKWLGYKFCASLFSGAFLYIV